jgi:hypothetical protein
MSLHHGHTHEHHDGQHGHDHPHPHVHHDATEVRTQPIVLDLGEGVGALIVHTPPDLLGIEVEISPAGEDGRRQHKEVLRRALGPTIASVLVYDNLAEGDYTLWIDDRAVARGVRVTGGQVSEHTLSL